MQQLPTDKMIALKEGGIGWMTFNNPERRNAISYEMRQAILQILDDFEADPAIRVIVLKGAGDKAFVSGSDISQFEKRRATPEQQNEYAELSTRVQQRYDSLTKPLIAMISGYCLGGGLGTALNADLRIAAEESEFGVPAGRLGIVYNWRGVKRLTALIGPANAKEMLFTARRFSAAEALRMGLVNRVVPRSDLESSVRDLAATIAGNAPLSVAGSKRMVDEAMKDPDEQDEAMCKLLSRAALASEDYVEGRRAFMEKRKPNWVGR